MTVCCYMQSFPSSSALRCLRPRSGGTASPPFDPPFDCSCAWALAAALHSRMTLAVSVPCRKSRQQRPSAQPPAGVPARKESTASLAGHALRCGAVLRQGFLPSAAPGVGHPGWRTQRWRRAIVPPAHNEQAATCSSEHGSEQASCLLGCWAASARKQGERWDAANAPVPSRTHVRRANASPRWTGLDRRRGSSHGPALATAGMHQSIKVQPGETTSSETPLSPQGVTGTGPPQSQPARKAVAVGIDSRAHL